MDSGSSLTRGGYYIGTAISALKWVVSPTSFGLSTMPKTHNVRDN